MKIATMALVIISFTAYIYAMESDERADGDGRSLGDLIATNQVEIRMNTGALIVTNFNGISSLACNNVNKNFADDVQVFHYNRSYLTNVTLTDLSVFNNLQELALEYCFIRQLQFDDNKTLPALRILSLACNELKKIELEKLLKAMPQLKRLNLSNNPIEEIILDGEYQHASLGYIILVKTDYLKESKKMALADKIRNSTVTGKQPVIGW